MRQTKLEKKFEDFVARYGLSYMRYDLTVPRCGQNRPDFQDMSRESRFVDLYHPTYHSFGEAVGRIAFFGARDYKMLIIWDAEFEDEARLLGKIRVFEQTSDSPGFSGMVKVANERAADEVVIWRCSDVAQLDAISREVTDLIARPLNLCAFEIECFAGERDMAALRVRLTADRLSIDKVIKGLLTSEPISIHEERPL